MTTRRKNVKALDEEIARTQADIARLQAKLEGLVRAREIVSGETPMQQVREPRKRATLVKPLVLKIMEAASETGATSSEVADRVQETAPTVSKDTVGSILSRLKGDGALVHDGERYYDKRFGPKGDKLPFEIRAVS
jgi:hypothetical protein